MHKFDRAKSEATLAKRLHQYDTAQHACEQAIALYDHLAILLHLLREAIHICSPQGNLRTRAGVRAELTVLFEMIAALDCAAITTTLTPLQKHLDDLVAPFAQTEATAVELRAVVPPEACEFLVLAWHHEPLVYQAGARAKRYHQRERDLWLAVAEGLLGDAFDTHKTFVFDKLDAIVRASSLVEMVNSLLRPSLNSCKGQITQEAVNLIMFYHNHRRYKSGKRQGKAPIELLTGPPLAAPWWELLRQQINVEQGAPDYGSLPSKAPLHLVVQNDGEMERQAMALGQACGEPFGVAENDRRHQDAEAA